MLLLHFSSSLTSFNINMANAASSPIAAAFTSVDPKVALIVTILAVLVYYVKQSSDLKKRKAGAKTLPGPKGLPVIGNLKQIPAQKPWVKLKEWADEYGE